MLWLINFNIIIFIFCFNILNKNYLKIFIYFLGKNLRTGQNGIFPTAHICKIDLVNEICQEALTNTNNISSKNF